MGLDNQIPGGKRQLCVVVPMHNEAENILGLVNALCSVAATLERWEMTVLFVDDGSADDSVARIEALRNCGVPVGCLRLSRNFGHQAALMAGMLAASGDAVLTMDADLQHPPAAIHGMVREMEGGADVVQMVRASSQHGAKGLLSRSFYRVFNLMSKTHIVPDAPDFRLLSRRVVDILRQIPEREKFLRGLIPMLGFRQVILPYVQGDRAAGTPTYGFGRSLRLARKALFDFSTIPLRLVFWIGMFIAVLSFLAGMGFIIEKLLRWEKVTPGFPDLIVSLLFLSGCVLMSIGVLGRYMIMVLDELRGRPSYVVMDHLPPSPLPSQIPPPVL